MLLIRMKGKVVNKIRLQKKYREIHMLLISLEKPAATVKETLLLIVTA